MPDSIPAQNNRPTIGLGACLSGRPVRYTGDTNDPNVHVQTVCGQFEVQAFCPEMGIGLGVPRPPIHLVGSAEAVRVLDVASHQHDYTDEISAYAQRILREAPLLCGYVLVKGSPSCGSRQVKRYSSEGLYIAADQDGIFTAALRKADPLLPLADDEELCQTELRHSFCARVRVYHAWKQLILSSVDIETLIAFDRQYRCRNKHGAEDSRAIEAQFLDNAEKLSLAILGRQLITRIMTDLLPPWLQQH